MVDPVLFLFVFQRSLCQRGTLRSW